MKLFCTICGKLLQFVFRKSTQKFERMTGAHYTIEQDVYQCPDYVDGYSDRAWHSHDKVVVRDGIVHDAGYGTGVDE